jgi:hypothetical protein
MKTYQQMKDLQAAIEQYKIDNAAAIKTGEATGSAIDKLFGVGPVGTLRAMEQEYETAFNEIQVAKAENRPEFIAAREEALQLIEAKRKPNSATKPQN